MPEYRSSPGEAGAESDRKQVGSASIEVTAREHGAAGGIGAGSSIWGASRSDGRLRSAVRRRHAGRPARAVP